MDGLLKIAAWACLAAVIVVALAPTGAVLEFPSSFLDRAFRYATLSFLLFLAYPKAVPSILVIVGALAVGLELAHFLLPGKAARLIDLLPKFAGASLGLALGFCVAMLKVARASRH